MSVPNYCLIFHANINYAFLTPDKYEFVIRNSYEKLVDLFETERRDAGWVFEASGYTIEKMAELAPDVLEKFRVAIERGKCEFMGSPYAHSILANVPYEDGLHALKFARETYKRLLGVEPRAAWNPECTWMSWMPDMFKEAGYDILLCDWDSYLLSNREDVRALEYDPDRTRTSGHHMPWFDVDPNDPSLRYPFELIPGLKGVMRTDRPQVPPQLYILGEGSWEKAIEAIDHWTGNGDGALVLFAEDAEYIGTTGYYFLKHEIKPVCFEDAPESVGNLNRIIGELLKRGNLVTMSDIVDNQPLNKDVKPYWDDKMAWHRTFADAWANVVTAKEELDPLCDKVRAAVKKAEAVATSAEDRAAVRDAWFNLIQAENSDGRWPPNTQCDYNVQYCRDAASRALAAIEKIG